jgi:hypothetical protein
MTLRNAFRLTLLVAVLALLLGAPARAQKADEGFWLITPEEAAQPDAPPETPAAVKLRTRGRTAPETLGPKVEMLSPPDGQPTAAPVTLQVKFTANLAPIDLNSLKVKVVKLIKIDITERVKPYLSAEGITIPDAKFPSGKFRVKLEIADVKGNITEGEAELIIK